MTTAAAVVRGVRRVARPHLSSPLSLVAVGVLALLATIAVCAPLLAPRDPEAVDLLHALAGPSAEHPLGTDRTGRDLLSRLIYGARPTLAGPALVAAGAVAAGTTIAICAAWLGGWVDELSSRLLDVLFALPGLLLAIVAVAIFGAGLATCVAALTIAYVPYMARLIRGPALRVRAQPYIAACELQGFSAAHICLRRILPALMPLVAGQAAIAFGAALIDLSALSFLGLSVEPPAADWGVMVANGRQDILQGSPHEALFAGALIVVTVVAVNIVGERLADRAELVRL